MNKVIESLTTFEDKVKTTLDSNLTREQAMSYLELGFKVTHKDFIDGEYIELIDGNIKTDDGHIFDSQFVNRIRFEDGWSLLGGVETRK